MATVDFVLGLQEAEEEIGWVGPSLLVFHLLLIWMWMNVDFVIDITCRRLSRILAGCC